MYSQSDQPLQVLSFDLIKSKLGGTFEVTDSDPMSTPLYAVDVSAKGKPALAIYRRPSQQRPERNSRLNFLASNFQGVSGNVIGSVIYHSMSSKIDVSVHGESFQMKRRDILSCGHSFKTTPLPFEMQWKEEDIVSSNLKLVDQEKRVIARYRKSSKLHNMFSRSNNNKRASELQIMIPLDDRMLDAVVITGLAAAEYRRRSDQEISKVVGEVVGGISG